MAGRNGMGPLEMSSMKGRGFGGCRGGFFSPRSNLGFRSRCGVGYGRELFKTFDKNFIEEEKAILESRLKRINEILKNSEDED